jgi:hypothetical protein
VFLKSSKDKQKNYEMEMEKSFLWWALWLRNVFSEMFLLNQA